MKRKEVAAMCAIGLLVGSIFFGAGTVAIRNDSAQTKEISCATIFEDPESAEQMENYVKGLIDENVKEINANNASKFSDEEIEDLTNIIYDAVIKELKETSSEYGVMTTAEVKSLEKNIYNKLLKELESGKTNLSQKEIAAIAKQVSGYSSTAFYEKVLSIQGDITDLNNTTNNLKELINENKDLEKKDKQELLRLVDALDKTDKNNAKELEKAKNTLNDKIEELGLNTDEAFKREVGNLNTRIDSEIALLTETFTTSLNDTKEQLTADLKESNDKNNKALAKINADLAASNDELVSQINANKDLSDADKAELLKLVGDLESSSSSDLASAKEALQKAIDDNKDITDQQKAELAKATEDLSQNVSLRMDNMKKELQGNISSTKTELQGNIDSTKTTLEGNISSTKSELQGSIDAKTKAVSDKLDEQMGSYKIRVVTSGEYQNLVNSGQIDGNTLYFVK